LLFVAFCTACVNSKSSSGRNEAEVSVTSKTSAHVMPQLRRTIEDNNPKLDSLTSHTLDWSLLQSQLQTVAHRLDRRFYVEGFGPFIIATNIPRKRLEEIKENTIRLSYNAFYKDFFTERPRRIITLYLFKNYTDYSFYSRKIFNETPTTPYGYYRSA